MSSKTIWKICCVAILVIAVLTLTPVVTPHHIFEPMLMGMPYTLWMGIVISLVLWVITYIGIQHHPGKND